MLKTDVLISGPYLFRSHRSLQIHDLLSAYFSNRVIRMLRDGICVFNNRRYLYVLRVLGSVENPHNKNDSDVAPM